MSRPGHHSGSGSPADRQEPLLQVAHLSALYGTYLAINDVNFTVAPGEFFTLLGPSGCGKTSTLRCVAGLETPSAGAIAIGGDVVYSSDRKIDVPANRRDIAMVFQSYAIWPHMTVSGNVAFPLQARGVSRSELDSRVSAALETVGLTAMADRPAPLLSGGQQQRVALARAIVTGSKLLLLDEPLSNLDATLRIQMRSELRDLQRRLGVTMIYVTHDQEEAMSLSDRIAVMQKGSIVELDTPRNLYHRPRNLFTARFIGQSELIPCEVTERPRGGKIHVSSPVGLIASTVFPDSIAPGRHFLLVRSEHIQILPAGQSQSGQQNIFSGTIDNSVFSGKLIDYRVRVNGTFIDVQTLSSAQWRDGDAVTIHMPPEHCVVIGGEEKAG